MSEKRKRTALQYILDACAQRKVRERKVRRIRRYLRKHDLDAVDLGLYYPITGNTEAALNAAIEAIDEDDAREAGEREERRQAEEYAAGEES